MAKTHLLTKRQYDVPGYDNHHSQDEYKIAACGHPTVQLSESVQDVDCELCKKTRAYRRAIMSQPIEVTDVHPTKEGVVITGILPPGLHDAFRMDPQDFSIGEIQPPDVDPPWSRLAGHFGVEVMSENQAREMFGMNRVCSQCGNNIVMMTQLGTNYCSSNCQEAGEAA